MPKLWWWSSAATTANSVTRHYLSRSTTFFDDELKKSKHQRQASISSISSLTSSPSLPILPTLYGVGGIHSLKKKRRTILRIPTSISIALAIVFIISVYTTHLVSPCYIGWLWHYRNRCLGNVAHPWAASPSTARTISTNTGERPKIAIAMIADNFMQPDIRNLTIRNKQRYAQVWGYDLFVPDQEELLRMAGGLPVAWAKFPLIKKVLKTHEYVMVIDADAVILREDISLHKAVDTMGNHSLLISDDHNGPNSGVFMLRRSEWTRQFLDEAMKSASILSEQTRKFPLRFENRAFFYLLNSWPKCGPFVRVDSVLAPVATNTSYFVSGVKTIDRCLINRRPPRATRPRDLFDSGASFDVVDDAFVAHAAGGSIKSKVEVLRWLLSVAPLS